MTSSPIRLSSMAHGGGCGCKLSPKVLSELLAGSRESGRFERLLVGVENSDDAAVWQLDERTLIVATTDFFTPMVDDARDFGRIAATNALSDVYAMGGRPIFALAILGMPLGKIEPAQVRAILAGGREVCDAAGIPVAGGHSIDAPEPIYGLAVTGLCAPAELRRNCDALAGDRLILTKPIGVGIYSAAFKQDALTPADYAALIATTTQLNSVGAVLGRHRDVHAMTDVTGFGLLGHALEMARGSGLKFQLRAAAIPLLPRATELVRSGFVTGASARNWESYGHDVEMPAAFDARQRALLTDPQTSGGLLIACAADAAAEVLESIRTAGFAEAAVIGETAAGRGVTVA